MTKISCEKKYYKLQCCKICEKIITIIHYIKTLGLRRCPGEDLGNIELFLILANLLKSFIIRKPEGDNGDVGTFYETGTGVLRHPRPYYVVLQNRA